MDLEFGNFAQRRTISIGEDNSVKVLKKSGEVLGSWKREQLEGIAYTSPNGFSQGALVFCETYHESLNRSTFQLLMVPHSVQVTLGNRDSAEQILKWFEETKGANK
jgi:hypothetical protein